MKIENYQFNKSSFLSVEKDFSLIVDKILKKKTFTECKQKRRMQGEYRGKGKIYGPDYGKGRDFD